MKLSCRTVKGLAFFGVIALLCYSALLYYFHTQTQKFAFAEGQKQIENILLINTAIHSYVENIQKPEIYRLKKEGVLYSEYYSPKLLSRTFIARGIMEALNRQLEDKGAPPFFFKVASDNPRYQVNAADAFERELLERMRSGAISEYVSIEEGNGHPSLYYAIPVAKISFSCLQCHGNPETAPDELLAQYGEAKGFHEAEGSIRALISIRVPLDAQIKTAHQIFIRLSVGAGLLILVLVGVVLLFTLRLESHQRIIECKNEELKRLATVDPLTGIYNRQGFLAIMQQELAVGVRYEVNISLIMMDLDLFKQVNDTYGHGVGDAVLAITGKLLSSIGRSSDIVTRWGGEEFVIACLHTELDGAMALARKIQLSLPEQDFPQGIRMTASFGVALRQPQESLEQLINRADMALYESKKSGRNRISRASADG